MDDKLSIGGIHGVFTPLYVYVWTTKAQLQMDSKGLHFLTPLQ